MKYLLICLLLFSNVAFSQNILGQWKTIDDKTGKEKSIVEIYEKSGRVYGKIIKIFPKAGDDPNPVCDECDKDDDRYNKKVIGMEIIRNMSKTEDGTYEDGNILDPEVGKVYRCKLWLEDAQLMVRGYWGPMFRTQVWKRVN